MDRSRDKLFLVHHVIRNMAEEPDDQQSTEVEETDENDRAEDDVTFSDGQVIPRPKCSQKIFSYSARDIKNRLSAYVFGIVRRSSMYLSFIL